MLIHKAKPNETSQLAKHVRQHYLLEKKLAQRILKSSSETRSQVTIEAYDELFSSIPWHPSLSVSEEKVLRRLAEKQTHFEHLVGINSDVLDIGTGTGYWIRYLSKKGKGRCAGVDISGTILRKRPDDPPNLELRIMDAVRLDYPADTFDIALSSQLIEHLHPDDVERHLASVYRVLREKGVYAFDTPSQLNGPHDVSKYFDEVATGFHLKEWTYEELASQLKRVGFRRIRTMSLPWSLVKRWPYLRTLGTVPVSLLIPGERLMATIKYKRLRAMLCKWFRVTPIYIVAEK